MLSHEEHYRHVRVLRGGSWNNNPNNIRAANRNNNKPTNTNNNIGFRCLSAQYPRRGMRRVSLYMMPESVSQMSCGVCVEESR